MDQCLDTSTVDAALKRRITLCKSLPSPPAVALRIIELGEDPFVTLEQVAEAIQGDPALSAKMLRVANSSMYARRYPAETLAQAVVRIGLSGTMSLALSFSMVHASQGTRAEGLDLNRFWLRSVTNACAARLLCERRDREQGDRAFLTGLFADIGMVILDKLSPDLYQGLKPAAQSHAALAAREREVLGCDHAPVGAFVLERWNLPEELVRAVANTHHTSAPPQDGAPRRLDDCAAVGGQIAGLCTDGVDPQAVVHTARLASERFGLDEQGFAEFMEQVGIQSRELAAEFDIDMDDALLLEGISEQAKEILLLRNLSAIRQSEALRSDKEHLENRTEVLEQEVRRDSLTGTFNRGYFEVGLSAAFDEAAAKGRPLAIAFVDLDHFKRVNDTHGHQAGDAVLQYVAGLLSGLSRPGDCVARYGGEEFVLILPETDRETAVAHCERLLAEIRRQPVTVNGGTTLTVTASIGLAIDAPTHRFAGCKALVQAADTAMYRAKHGGRNQLMVALQSADAAV